MLLHLYVPKHNCYIPHGNGCVDISLLLTGPTNILFRCPDISPRSLCAPPQVMQSSIDPSMRRSNVHATNTPMKEDNHTCDWSWGGLWVKFHIIQPWDLFRIEMLLSFQLKDKWELLKVVCTIQLHLADENGVKLDVFRWQNIPQKTNLAKLPPKICPPIPNSCRDVPLAASMALFEGSTCRWVDVKVKLEQTDSWSLAFTPPSPGIAHLSVVIGGRHVRNSPYVLHVRSLSLDSHEEIANLNSKTKKCVRFNNEVSMWANNMFSFLLCALLFS